MKNVIKKKREEIMKDDPVLIRFLPDKIEDYNYLFSFLNIY